MAGGFVDVSALLQRKTFNLDPHKTPGKPEDEAQNSIGVNNDTAAPGKSAVSKLVSTFEQRGEGKLPPRSPKSALSLQASPAGTPSSRGLTEFPSGNSGNDVRNSNGTQGPVDSLEKNQLHMGSDEPPQVENAGLFRPGQGTEATEGVSNANLEQGSVILGEPAIKSTSLPVIGRSGDAPEGKHLVSGENTQAGVAQQAPVRGLSLPFVDAVDAFEEGGSVSRTTSIENDARGEWVSAGPSLISSVVPLRDGKNESLQESQHELSEEVRPVQAHSNLQNGDEPHEDTENGSSDPGVGSDSPGKGGGRLTKVGGLLKKTLSFTRSKSGGSGEQGARRGEETLEDENSNADRGMLNYHVTGEAYQLSKEEKNAVPIAKEVEGADLAKDWLNAKIGTLQEKDRGHPASEALSPTAGQVAHPAPQVARSDSGRVRNLLRKLMPGMPGGLEAAEAGPPHAEERVTGGPLAHDLPSPQGVSDRNVEGVTAARTKPGERDFGGDGTETSALNGGVGGNVRVLLRQRSKESETAIPAGVPRAVEPDIRLGKYADRASVFRIPKRFLPGQSVEKMAGVSELEGGDDPPARPLVVFVDSKAASEREAELQLELREILGQAQVFDVAHRPAGDFLAALLSKLNERARSGDHVAAVVKDNLRILVAGDDTLFKSVTQALQQSKAWRGIPIGCVAAGGRSHVSRALGLGRGLDDVSKESAFELLTQAADAGTQAVDCWEVTLSNHRKRTAANLPPSLERIPVEGAKGDWVLSHRGLCWGSVHLDMGYGSGHTGSKNAKSDSRQAGGWMCGLCSTSAPQVIRSQNVGRLEILKEGVWSYLELSPQIQSLEFVNLAEEPTKTRRKMKMLEKGLAEAYADDGLIEIVGVQEGSDAEICLAQTNAVRLELFGNAEIDHVKLRLDSESWDQPLAGETTADPAVIQIAHGGRIPVLVPHSSTLRCTAAPVFRPSVFAPAPAETTAPERSVSGLFRRRSPSPFRKGGRFRSPSPFRRKTSRRSPSPQRSSVTPDAPVMYHTEPITRSAPSTSEFAPPSASEVGPKTSEFAPKVSGLAPSASESVRPASEYISVPSEVSRGRAGVPETNYGVPSPRSAAPERTFVSPRGKRRNPSPVPGRSDREGRSGSAEAQNGPGGYADAAAAAAKGLGGVSARRPGVSVPWMLKTDKLVEVERVQPQQKLGRSGSGRQEIVEPVAKTLVRTGSGRLDEYGRPPSPALYRSSSRDNLEQAALSRPASPALYRSSSRDNLEQAGGLSRPPSPALGRQNSGNTGYSPRGTSTYLPRSESPVHARERDPTPERLPRMADWATGMSRRSASLSYNPGVHSHLLTKQEREHAVAIGLGSSLTREERERMQALAFGNSSGYSGYDRVTSYSGYDRATTPQRIRSARARYIGAGTPMYAVRGPLELDLATSNEPNSPPPPVRTAKDYFSGPLTPSGESVLRRSHA